MPGQCINININGSIQNGGDNSSSSSSSVGSWENSSAKYKGDWGYRDLSVVKLSQYDNLFKKAGKVLGLDWRLVAAHSYCESSWKTEVKASSTSAGGLYQFLSGTWKGHAPRGYEDPSNRYKPEPATEAYIDLMGKLLKKFSNADSTNDRVLLSLQSYHDGTIGGTSWANVKGNKYTYKQEGQRYVPKIMKKYQEFGGVIS